jgi:phage terminase large subunit-like protein
MSTRKPPPLRRLSRGQRVIAFIHRYCHVPEGKLVGKLMVLDEFQKDWIIKTFDNPHGTKRSILSIPRKNGKTALIAGVVLACVAGPEATLNSQVVSGAMSRAQAALVFRLAAKMVRLSETLSRLVRIVPSTKTLVGITLNVEYQAVAADAKTQHGLSPRIAILDEIGQVVGPQSDFVDAITTSQGAYDDALLIAISTQAAADTDLFSLWIDDAKTGEDPQTVLVLYEAPAACDVMDAKAWAVANPALGNFRSIVDVRTQARRASRMSSAEPAFRRLILNQRVPTVSPFVTMAVLRENGAAPDDAVFRDGGAVYVGLDLSSMLDLSTATITAKRKGITHVKLLAWTPMEELEERGKRDKTPYVEWVKAGFMRAVPGRTLDYGVIANDLMDELKGMNVKGFGFDRWRIDVLQDKFPRKADQFPFAPFGQGFKDMSPAIETLEAELVGARLRHGNHPVLMMCLLTARIMTDPAGNRKFTKAKSTHRIDAAISTAIAVQLCSVPPTKELDYYSAGGKLLVVG